jgi:hypothetical protein
MGKYIRNILKIKDKVQTFQPLLPFFLCLNCVQEKNIFFLQSFDQGLQKLAHVSLLLLTIIGLCKQTQ